MNFCNNNTYKESYFETVGEITEEIWQDLGCESNLYFSRGYLTALAQNNPQVAFSYIVLFDEAQNPVALGTIQIVDFHLDSVQNEMQSITEKAKCIGRKLGLLSEEKPLKILTCGNTFVSGEHGLFIKPNNDRKIIIKEIAKAITKFVNSNKLLKNEVSAYMLKDFIKESLFISDELHDLNYNSFNVEPNMVLNLDKDWNSFDDYLAAMKTKFRVKAKKAIKQSANLRVEEVTLDAIDAILPKMTELYKMVSYKASFNLGDFNLDTYKSLKENLGENYVLKVYWLDDTLVGFLSGIINNNSLDAHFVGIDYTFNREHAVYQRMLYDYIEMAITNKLSVVSFGRTASEIKSSIGAIPQDLTIYLRHKKSIPNKILSPFLKRISPSEFNQKHPFKEKK